MKKIIFILLFMFLSVSLTAERGAAYFNKGIAYILADDVSLATKNMNRYFNINPNPALRSGFLKLINKDKEGATERFRGYLNINHRSTLALVGIALATADMEVSNTMEVLERALRLNSRFSPAYLCLGTEYMKKNNFPQAERNLKRALNLAYVPEYKIILARLYLLRNNPQGVISLLKNEADKSPDNFYYSFLIAGAYFKLNNLRDTGRYIEVALVVNPGNNDAKLLMAKYLVGINDLKRARSLLKGLTFNTYNKDFVKTYARVLLELKDLNVKDYLYEFFAQDKWDKDINRLMGHYYRWRRGKGNVQNWIARALLSGAEVSRLKKEFPGDYRFPEYKYIPFFDIKKIQWLSEKMILLAAVKQSGAKERLYLIDSETLKIIRTFDFKGEFQQVFVPSQYDGSGNINILFSTLNTDNESVNLYALGIAGRRIVFRPVYGLGNRVPAVTVGFNAPGNLAYITDAAISSVAFESPFSKISALGKKTPIYPFYPFHIYQYNFNTYRLTKVSDLEKLRRAPINEVRKFFQVADAYQYNDDIKHLIKTGESLDLTSTEVVRTYIPDNLSYFIIYLADLTNAFQAIIYDSSNNRIKKIDETMFLGRGQYAEIKILDFRPQNNELVVMTNDRDRRLINFNYHSFLYERLARNTFDFCRNKKPDTIYILTERSKLKHYTETDLEVVNMNPYSRKKLHTRKDLNKIISCEDFDRVYFSTYNGELLKMDVEHKFHYTGPSFEGALSAVSPRSGKRAAFINGRLLII
ncbi:MAG: hypothetical protein KAT34_12760 [Candidatus Aminicenantes bacterium]|nr:hypothetical protein [Candidatus Aminicenantes bacterium]